MALSKRMERELERRAEGAPRERFTGMTTADISGPQDADTGTTDTGSGNTAVAVMEPTELPVTPDEIAELLAPTIFEKRRDARRMIEEQEDRRERHAAATKSAGEITLLSAGYQSAQDGLLQAMKDYVDAVRRLRDYREQIDARRTQCRAFPDIHVDAPPEAVANLLTHSIRWRHDLEQFEAAAARSRRL